MPFLCVCVCVCVCILVGTWLVDGVEVVTEVYTGLSMVKIGPNFFLCVYVANHQMATLIVFDIYF